MENIHETTLNKARIHTKLLCIFVFLFVFVWFSVLPSVARAATLYFSPSSGSYNVGEQFSVSVYVSSVDQAMNAASGVISFPSDKLEVTSLSKTGSIFNLWVEEPSFSNSNGTVNFEGIVLNPGFTGAAGKIITANFKVKAAGVATLNFSSGSVLANDGKGTNILANMGSASYKLTAREITPIIPPEKEYVSPPTVGVPAAPIVTSPTSPDENKWYSNNNPEFEWNLPSDVIAISYDIDQNPNTNPTFIAESLIKGDKFFNLSDGIWYFHINFKNQYGWGKLTHRKLMIDTKPPLPFEIEVKMEDPTDPQPVLFFDTTDELSGIEYYELTIGKGEPFQVRGITRENPLKLPHQAPGKYLVVVRAFDKAGNFTDAKKEIEILPIPIPEIKSCPKSIYPNSSLTLEGKSIKDAKIMVFLQREGEEPVLREIKTSGDGKWIFISDSLKEGKYKVWVQAKDERGALSLPSKACEFYVGLPAFLRFGKIAIDYLSIMATLIFIIIGLLLIIFYAWYRISIWRKRLRTETKEVAQAVLAAFKALREEVQEQIEYLDGKAGLTDSEAKVREKLKEALDISEKFIGKELKDIEKELE